MRTPTVDYLFLLLACTACGNPDKGCPLNYSKGDQFRITVNGYQTGYFPCALMPLTPGTTFVVTASNHMTNDGCNALAAEGVVPEFASGITNTCKPGDEQLGIYCDCLTADGCAIPMWTGVNQTPSAAQKVIEHAYLYITWGTGLTDAGARCLPDCNLDRYDVRIERL